MDNFNNIPKTGTFGQSVDVMNQNFALAKEAIDKLAYKESACVGFYTTSSALSEANPNPTDGNWALVGDETPFSVYVADDGEWVDTGVAFVFSTPIVNNLDDGGSTSALSAEQGKVLKGITDSIIGVEQTDLPLLANSYGYYTTSGTLAATTNENYRNTGKVAIPSGYNTIIAYTAATTSMCAIAFFDSSDNFISASSVVGVGQVMHLYQAAVPSGAATVAISLRKVGGELNYYYAYMGQSDISLTSLSNRIAIVGKDVGQMPVYIANSNQYVNTSGAITATTGDKYKTTDKVEIPVWCDRVRCRTASTTAMCAIAFFDADGDFMSDDKVVVGAELTTSIQTFDVAVPLGAKYLICSTIYATAFRCIMYNDTLWHDDWLPQLLVLGDSITYCTEITTSSGKTTTYKLHETTPADKWVAQLMAAINSVETRCYAMTGGHWCDNSSATAFQNLSEQISVAVADKENPNGIFMSDDFDPNVIILALGTNDAGGIDGGDYTLGDVDTTMAKNYANLDMGIFSDAVRKCLEDIRTTWKSSDIYVSLPIYRHSDSVMPEVEQVRDVLRAIAPKYGCRIIEAGALSGIYRYNQGELLRDGLHPNQAGQDKLAEVIIGHVRGSLGSVHVSSGGSSVTVVDNLTSTSSTSALSAKQGKVLNESKQDKRTLESVTHIWAVTVSGGSSFNLDLEAYVEMYGGSASDLAELQAMIDGQLANGGAQATYYLTAHALAVFNNLEADEDFYDVGPQLISSGEVANVTLATNKYYDLGECSSIVVSLPTTTAMVAGYSVSISGTSSDADALLSAFKIYDDDPYDYEDISNMLADQEANGGSAGTYDLTATALTALTSASNDRDEYGDDIPVIGNTTSKQVEHTVANYTRADEFLFTFTANSSSVTLTLPTGVVMADHFDFESDVSNGARFQFSIYDGMAAYLVYTPSNNS